MTSFIKDITFKGLSELEPEILIYPEILPITQRWSDSANASYILSLLTGEPKKQSTSNMIHLLTGKPSILYPNKKYIAGYESINPLLAIYKYLGVSEYNDSQYTLRWAALNPLGQTLLEQNYYHIYEETEKAKATRDLIHNLIYKDHYPIPALFSHQSEKDRETILSTPLWLCISEYPS